MSFCFSFIGISLFDRVFFSFLITNHRYLFVLVLYFKGAEINQTRIDVKDLCTCLSKGVDIVISADPEKALLNKRDPTSKRTKMFTTISLVFLGACIFRGCFKHRN